MKGQKGMWVDLDSIINDYLNESEQPNTKYWKCYHLAYRCMDDLGIDFFYQVKSVRLPLNASKTFNLPDDCLQWVKVGFFNGRGEVVPLRYNGLLNNFAAGHPDRRLRTGISSLFFNGGGVDNIFHNYYGEGGVVTNIYGVPGGNYNGTFNIDNHTSIVTLGFDFDYQDLILEYIANPGATQGCRIPVQFCEAVISWLWWKDNLASVKRASTGSVQQRMLQYYNDRRLGRSRYKPFRFDQAYIWSLANQRLAVKA